MSILFSNFALEIRTTSSPPETRLIGNYMLYIHFLTADSGANIQTRSAFIFHCNYKLQTICEVTDTMLGFRLKMEEVKTWKNCKEVISQFEDIIKNQCLRAEIWEVYFS